MVTALLFLGLSYFIEIIKSMNNYILLAIMHQNYYFCTQKSSLNEADTII